MTSHDWNEIRAFTIDILKALAAMIGALAFAFSIVGLIIMLGAY